MEPDAASGVHSSGIKTILFHVVDDGSLEARLDSALALASACSAHISFLHVTPIEAYVAYDDFGGIFAMNKVVEALEEVDADLKAKIERRLRNEDVRWDYEQVTANVTSMLISRAALADLLVTARHPTTNDFVGPSVGFLGDLLCRSRTPLFIPGPDPVDFDPMGPALVAWNGSFEASNTVRASLGLLRLASKVCVLEISEKAKPDKAAFPGTRLLEYLSRQGVHAELTVKPSPTGGVGYETVGEMIAGEAERRAAYVVMGGYSHARIGEWAFGGVTRLMLQGCPVPLVIGH
jgi:nucleotide-binding universal stress UspA family protein